MMECATLCACVCVRAYVCSTQKSIVEKSPNVRQITVLPCTSEKKPTTPNTFFSLSYDDVTGWSFLNNK